MDLKEAVRGAKAVCFDLDFTLTHFTGSGRKGLLDIFAVRGLREEFVGEALDFAEARGFTFARFREEVERKMAGKFNRPELLQVAFDMWLEANLSLYQDVPKAFDVLKANAARLAICSFGNEVYQKQKIAYANLVTDVIRITTEPETKWLYVLDLHRESLGKVVFVDDKPQELDEVRANRITEENVVTVRMLRDDSPYATRGAQFKHHEIHSLEELVRAWGKP